MGRTIGLLGNGDGDPTNDLAIGGGLTLPLNVGFDEFNTRFGDTWRVSASQSLFGAAVGARCENHQFHFSDLTPAQSARAFTTRRSLGINAGNLNVCAMDVAVIGDDAAFAFVGMPAPRAVVTHDLAAGLNLPGFGTQVLTSSDVVSPAWAFTATEATLPTDELSPSDLANKTAAATGCGCGSTGSGPMVFGLALLGLAMMATRRRRPAFQA